MRGGARRQAVVRNRPEGILGDVKGKGAENDEEGERAEEEEEGSEGGEGGGDATTMQ